MARTQTMVQLSEDLLAQLDTEAERLGCSRSALIREAVELRLASSVEAERVRRYVDGYRRIPQADNPLTHASEQSRHALALRLDAEEEAAGLAW